jgi:hypothetical protein
MNQARTRSRSTKSLACVVGVSAALGGTGCAPSNSVKSGAPVMLSFGAVDPDGNAVSFTSDAGSVAAPPLAHFVAIFDRVLDGDSLEDADAGVPKAGIAGGEYVGSLATPLPVPVTTNYVPNGDSKFYTFLPQGPSLTLSPICGLPAGASVQISVNLAKLRSHDLSTVATPDVGVTPTLAFTTDALSVVTDIPPPIDPDPTAGIPGGPAVLDAQTVVTLTFNDSMPAATPLPGCTMLPSTATHIHVSTTVGGAPVLQFEPVIAQVDGDPTHWTVSPPGTADAMASWPEGALVTVTVDATATDYFGMALGAPVTASFMVKS